MRNLSSFIVVLLLAGCTTPKTAAPSASAADRRPHVYSITAVTHSDPPANFKDYDFRFMERVYSRWFELLDQLNYDSVRSGQVTLQFHLTPDGRITDLKTLSNQVGDAQGLFCQKAILDPAPYQPWPQSTRKSAGKEFRELQITFSYQ